MQKKAIIVFVREPRYLPIFVIYLKNERGVSNQTLIDATIAFYSKVGYDNVKATIRNNDLETVIEVVTDPVSNLIPKVLNWSFYSCYEQPSVYEEKT
jgi:hypothetical protein